MTSLQRFNLLAWRVLGVWAFLLAAYHVLNMRWGYFLNYSGTADRIVREGSSVTHLLVLEPGRSQAGRIIDIGWTWCGRALA